MDINQKTITGISEESIDVEEPPHPWQSVPIEKWQDWRWQLSKRLESNLILDSGLNHSTCLLLLEFWKRFTFPIMAQEALPQLTQIEEAQADIQLDGNVIQVHAVNVDAPVEELELA